jgi:hypothetical protein
MVTFYSKYTWTLTFENFCVCVSFVCRADWCSATSFCFSTLPFTFKLVALLITGTPLATPVWQQVNNNFLSQ